MSRSDDTQCQVDDGHVTTLGVVAIFTDTFTHFNQPHGSEHSQHHTAHHWKTRLLEPRVAQLQLVCVWIIPTYTRANW